MHIPRKIYDLSQPIFHNCPGYPGMDLAVLNLDFQHCSHGFNAETLTMNMHTGTHLDVPFHFFPDGKKLHEFPIETFAGPAWCLT